MSQIGLSASTIASSFGKTISENKDLGDYRPEDISLSLLRMISYNIGQVCSAVTRLCMKMQFIQYIIICEIKYPMTFCLFLHRLYFSLK